MDKKEQEFKRKALGVVDTEKEMQLMQGPFKPKRSLLETPFAEPYVIMTFCKGCGDYAFINRRGVLLLETLIELYGMDEKIPEELTGYFVELEICPICNEDLNRMYFKFRKVEEVMD
jgi:hypothetical protein